MVLFFENLVLLRVRILCESFFDEQGAGLVARWYFLQQSEQLLAWGDVGAGSSWICLLQRPRIRYRL